MPADKASETQQADAWTGVVRAIQLTQHAVLSDVAEIGVPAQWFAVLRLLLREPGERLPMSRLANDLSMTSGGFTKLADRMAREGLIDRRGSSGDRRVVYAALTDRGRELARSGTDVYAHSVQQRLADVLGEPEFSALAATARQLLEVYGDRDVVEPADTAEDFAINARPPASPERRNRGSATAESEPDEAPRPSPGDDSTLGGSREETSMESNEPQVSG